MTKRTSQVSPRWALWRWFEIPDRNNPEVVYLKRLRIIQTPWFAVYLHWIYLPDSDRDPHDHPWKFWSFILQGGYREFLWTSRYDREDNLLYHEVNDWDQYSLHKMPIRYAHQIVSVEPGTVTLIITGKRHRIWGFWTPEGWVPYNKYDKGAGPDPFMS